MLKAIACNKKSEVILSSAYYGAHILAAFCRGPWSRKKRGKEKEAKTKKVVFLEFKFYIELFSRYWQNLPCQMLERKSSLCKQNKKKKLRWIS